MLLFFLVSFNVTLLRHTLKHFPYEALIWLTGLIALAFYFPDGSHFSICPFSWVGFSFCPGCGLGRSVSHLFHGEIMMSLNTHPLGIFAVIVLSYRIIELTKNYLKTHGKSY